MGDTIDVMMLAGSEGRSGGFTAPHCGAFPVCLSQCFLVAPLVAVLALVLRSLPSCESSRALGTK